jgi:hypothetical protein
MTLLSTGGTQPDSVGRQRLLRALNFGDVERRALSHVQRVRKLKEEAAEVSSDNVL